jgi:hypothetical protein
VAVITGDAPKRKSRAAAALLWIISAPFVVLLLTFVSSLIHPIHLQLGTRHLRVGLAEVGGEELGSRFGPGGFFVQVRSKIYWLATWTSPYSLQSLRRQLSRDARASWNVHDALQWSRERGLDGGEQGPHWVLQYEGSTLPTLSGTRVRRKDVGAVLATSSGWPADVTFLMGARAVAYFYFDKQRRFLAADVDEEWEGP